MAEQPIGRRAALRRIARAAAVGAAGAAPVWGRTRLKTTAAEMAVTVRLGEPIGTIRPSVYGQFAEHIGGVIYDGIWVGPDSKVANVGGIRRSLVEHVRRLGPVVVRWPGGCFADKYHWRDGIGPRDPPPRPVWGGWGETQHTH